MTVRCLQLWVKCPTVDKQEKPHNEVNSFMGKVFFVLNVDWCLLFNLLPQLQWHIVNDQRPNTTAEPKTPMCMHCFSLSTCLRYKATNTASQPTGECVLNNRWLILLTVLSCFYSIAITKPIFKIMSLFQLFMCLCVYQLLRNHL